MLVFAERLTPRASGPTLCTPDALQSLLEHVSRLERQSSAVLGGVTLGSVVLNELTKTAHLLAATTSVDLSPAAKTKCGWRYAEGAGSRLADAVDWNCGAWRACDLCFATTTHNMMYGFSGELPRVHARLRVARQEPVQRRCQCKRVLHILAVRFCLGARAGLSV